LTAESFRLKNLNLGEEKELKLREGVIPHKLTRRVVSNQVVWMESSDKARKCTLDKQVAGLALCANQVPAQPENVKV
jgi:hypothetical protein